METYSPRILAFAGATRTQSWNKKLVKVGAGIAEEMGATVTVVDLRDFSMPLYDGDIEAAEGLPDKARELKALMVAADGFLLSCPEYNSSISAVLKNTIDWISRPRPNEPPAIAFKGKVAGLLAASPGNLGGVRGLFTVRQILTTLGVIISPTQFALNRVATAFNDDGKLQEEGHNAAVRAVVSELLRLATRLRPQA